MNCKHKKSIIFSFLFFATYSYSNINLEVSRDSYLFSESKNSQLFKLNVTLKDDEKTIFKEQLNRENKIFFSNLEEKQYSFIIEFNSALRGKTKNKYNLNFFDSGFYKISLGKKDRNFSSPLVKVEGKIYAYRINDLIFTPSPNSTQFDKSNANSETMKTALRNLTLLYEQEIISKQEYLERRQLIILKFSK